MSINKNIRSGNLEVDEYIVSLEKLLLEKETSSIHKFIKAANRVAGVLASDLELMLDDLPENCILLKADHTDKTLERMMLVLGKNELFVQISKAATDQLPEVIEVEEIKNLELSIDPLTNAFEQLQAKHYKNRGKNSAKS